MSPTLAEYYESHYLPDRHQGKANTIQRSRESLNRLAEMFGHAPTFAEVTEASVDQFRSWLMLTRGIKRQSADVHCWRVTAILNHYLGKAPARHKPHRTRAGTPPAELEKLTQAAALYARGVDIQEAADTVGLRKTRLNWLKKQHRELWESQVGRAMTAVVEQVRATAGTDAVLDDTAAYIRTAERAEKWVTLRGGELFPSDGRMRLTEFYRQHYTQLSQRLESTDRLYRLTLRRWMLLTGNPPLEQITSAMLARYRDALSRLPGRKGQASANTVRMHLAHVQHMLDKAGPPGRRNRDAFGLIQAVPYIRPPREVLRMPNIVSDELLTRFYEACELATVPELHGVRPPDYWRALLVVTLSTGLRSGNLHRLAWEHVDLARAEIRLPAEDLHKSLREQVFPLNAVAVEHLRRIRSPRPRVFGHFTTEWTRRLWLKIQDQAGIPKSQQFGLHQLRRTFATKLFATDPSAAQLALGHSSIATTIRHYVQSTGIVARAVNSLPQPAIFSH